MRPEGIVRFADIGEFVDHHCLNIVFININYIYFFSNIMDTLCISFNVLLQ